MDTVLEKLNNKPRVSAKLIDRHTKHCKACDDRRLQMKNLFLEYISTERADEHIARDLLLDEMFEMCCKCFLGEQ